LAIAYCEDIIGRATRYLKEADMKPSQLHYSLHEQVMNLIATTRNVIWVPLPLGMVFCKVSKILQVYSNKSIDNGISQPDAHFDLHKEGTFDLQTAILDTTAVMVTTLDTRLYWRLHYNYCCMRDSIGDSVATL
jgi:hypothetical protein